MSSDRHNSMVDLAREKLDSWAFNVPKFAYDVFGIEAWDRQAEMMQSPLHGDHFCWKTGHKTGKSMTVAIIALWWALTRTNARVGITSSSFLQVKKIIWREIKRLYSMSKAPIGGKMHDDPRSGLVFSDGNEIFGFSTTDKERAAGFSSPHNLFLIDEASGRGVEVVYDALEGNIAGGGAIGMFGNPTRTAGTFFEAFSSSKSIWYAGTISSEETPNVKQGKVIVPGLATRPWIEMRKKEWGPEHPLYKIRVAGEFPRYSDNNIIPYYLVDEAQLRWRTWNTEEDVRRGNGEFSILRKVHGDIHIGVDVAKYGQDSSIIQVVRGPYAMMPKSFYGLDGVELAKEILDICDQIRSHNSFHESMVRIRVKIDIIGEGGSCWDQLKHNDRTKMLNVKVVPVDVRKSNESKSPMVYKDLNTEIIFGIREWMESGGYLPDDDVLVQELLFPTYIIDEKGRFCRVFNKKEERKPENLGRSPDRRDALAYALFEPRNVFNGSLSSKRESNSYGSGNNGSSGFDIGSGSPIIVPGSDWVKNFTG